MRDAVPVWSEPTSQSRFAAGEPQPAQREEGVVHAAGGLVSREAPALLRFAGLYQVNLQVPPGLAGGSYDLVVSTGNGARDPVPLRVTGPSAQKQDPAYFDFGAKLTSWK